MFVAVVVVDARADHECSVIVREQAKRLLDLLNDEEALQEAREVAKSTMNKYGGVQSSFSSGAQGFGSDSRYGNLILSLARHCLGFMCTLLRRLTIV